MLGPVGNRTNLSIAGVKSAGAIIVEEWRKKDRDTGGLVARKELDGVINRIIVKRNDFEAVADAPLLAADDDGVDDIISDEFPRQMWLQRYL